MVRAPAVCGDFTLLAVDGHDTSDMGVVGRTGDIDGTRGEVAAAAAWEFC